MTLKEMQEVAIDRKAWHELIARTWLMPNGES